VARYRVPIGRRTIVADTAWLWWCHEPHSLCWGVQWSTYETASGGLGLLLDLLPVPALALRLGLVVYPGGRAGGDERVAQVPPWMRMREPAEHD
jgi:hypothetical protein